MSVLERVGVRLLNACGAGVWRVAGAGVAGLYTSQTVADSTHQPPLSTGSEDAPSDTR